MSYPSNQQILVINEIKRVAKLFEQWRECFPAIYRTLHILSSNLAGVNFAFHYFRVDK